MSRIYRCDPVQGAPKVTAREHAAAGRFTDKRGIITPPHGAIVVAAREGECETAAFWQVETDSGRRTPYGPSVDGLKGDYGIVELVELQHKEPARPAALNGGSARPRFAAIYPHGAPDGEPMLRPVLNHEDGLPMVVAVCAMDSLGRMLVGYNRKLRVWDVPGGGVETGEAAPEAASRELLEETGVVAAPEQMFEVASFRHQTVEFPGRWATKLFMVRGHAVLDAASTQEADKFTDVAWLAPVQMPQPRGLSLRMALALTGHAT